MQNLISQKLREIAEIRAGHSFRETLKNLEEGFCRVIQVKDLDNDGNLSVNNLDKINFSISQKQLVKKGDVIFCPRQHKLVATLIDSELTNTIISAPLFLIRIIDQSHIIPEYVSVFMNSQHVQNQYRRLLSGSMIQTINKQDLENLIVPIPSMAKQKEFIQLNKFIRLENDLYKKIQELQILKGKHLQGEFINSLVGN